MGKCSKCGKKIEYNNYTVVDGIVYHRECTPKKTRTITGNNEPVSEELQKMVDKTTEEFLEREARKGTLESYNAFEGELKDAGKVADTLGTVSKKPRKKRVKK